MNNLEVTIFLSQMNERKTDTWQWQEWQGLPYLTCNLLQAWPHGFFTNSFYPSPPEKLVEVLHTQASVYRVRQVHGNRVLNPREIESALPGAENQFPAADGLISTDERQSLWVASADCTPVLIGDLGTGKVAAVHAGWRGTAQTIVPAAVRRFLSRGSRLGDLRLAMGPAIEGKVYQVTETVAAEVGASLLKKEINSSSEAILAALQAMNPSPLHPDPEPGRIRLDVRRVNALQLQQMGMRAAQIAIAPYCTYQQVEYFFSYRRTQEKKVQWSGIVSTASR
jgi:YfiH family protein